MNSEQPRSKTAAAFSKDLINLQDHQYLNNIMDVRTARAQIPHYMEVVKKSEQHRRSLSQGHGKRMSRYFTSESLFLLACLTASLLVLPLVLPPLPPPPFLLLLLPILILALLMLLAFMPSGAHTYA